jgi:hypothetical protein
MLRKAFVLLPLTLLFACKEPASKEAPTAPPITASATTAPSAVATTTATASASASAAPATKAGATTAGCAALEWDKDGMNAKAATFKGKVSNGEGSDANAKMEKFQTLVLEKPACGPDKAAVEEVQLYTNDKTIDLKKAVGKTVTIDGEPFASHTAHHHRPIVVEVKKLTAN